MTAEAGGRIYFAKDSTASADLIIDMYDELPAWRKAVQAADPAGVFATDMTRRLKLRGEA